MTTEMINEIMDACIRGTLLGISVFFWGCGLLSIWKWILGLAKKFVHRLCPNLFKKKDAEKETENK